MESSALTLGIIFVLIGTSLMALRIFNIVPVFEGLDHKIRRVDTKTRIIIILITTGALPFILGVFCIFISLYLR